MARLTTCQPGMREEKSCHTSMMELPMRRSQPSPSRLVTGVDLVDADVFINVKLSVVISMGECLKSRGLSQGLPERSTWCTRPRQRRGTGRVEVREERNVALSFLGIYLALPAIPTAGFGDKTVSFRSFLPECDHQLFSALNLQGIPQDKRSSIESEPAVQLINLHLLDRFPVQSC